MYSVSSGQAVKSPTRHLDSLPALARWKANDDDDDDDDCDQDDDDDYCDCDHDEDGYCDDNDDNCNVSIALLHPPTGVLEVAVI